MVKLSLVYYYKAISVLTFLRKDHKTLDDITLVEFKLKIQLNLRTFIIFSCMVHIKHKIKCLPENRKELHVLDM